MDSNCTSDPVQSLPLTPAGYLALAVGIEMMGVLANVVTIRVITKNKKLHSPCFILIGGATFGSFLAAIADLIVNTAGTGDRLGLWSQSNRTRGFCYLTNWYPLGAVAFPYTGIAVVLLAIDRFYGSVAPLKYRLLGKKYPIKALALAALSALIIGTVVISGVDSFNTEVPTCIFPLLGMGEWSFNLHNSIISILNTLCVLSYLTMFSSVSIGKWRMKRKINGGFATSAELQTYLKQQAIVTPAVKTLFILYIITGVAPTLLFEFITPGGVLYNVAVLFVVSSPLVEFVSLTLHCKEFRNGVRQLIRCNNN